MKFLKFTHPKMSGFLIAEPNETRENVANNYLGDDLEPDDLDAFTVTEVEMTQEECKHWEPLAKPTLTIHYPDGTETTVTPAPMWQP